MPGFPQNPVNIRFGFQIFIQQDFGNGVDHRRRAAEEGLMPPQVVGQVFVHAKSGFAVPWLVVFHLGEGINDLEMRMLG